MIRIHADAFASMAAQLTGTAPPAPSRAEVTQDRFARASAALRQTADPELSKMADGVDHWMAHGGDLAAALGARARRGRRDELPHHLDQQRKKRQAVRRAVEALGLESEKAPVAAKLLALMLARPGIGTCILREVAQGIDMPRSESQLVRILRAAER